MVLENLDIQVWTLPFLDYVTIGSSLNLCLIFFTRETDT